MSLLRSWSILAAVWPGMLVGTCVVLAGALVGWMAGAYRSSLGVRLIAWWVKRVIVPLLRTRSWLCRAATILANNGTISAVLVALGAWPWAAFTAVALLGINLGVALRVLSNAPDEFGGVEPGLNARDRRRIRFGVGLNLLEVPAIVAVLGLSIWRASDLTSATQVWMAFATLVLPLLLAAAAGEALWLGYYCRARKPDFPLE